MKIAVIAHIRHPIAEPFMGGMEVALSSTGEGAARHVGIGDAVRCERLRPARASFRFAQQPYEDVLPWANLARHRDAARLSGSGIRHRPGTRYRAGGFDVVHNNSLFPDLIDWAARRRADGDIAARAALYRRCVRRSGTQRACAVQPFTVTSRQQLACGMAARGRSCDVVHNGIEARDWPVARAARRTADLVWPHHAEHKGLREAVACRAAGGRRARYRRDDRG